MILLIPIVIIGLFHGIPKMIIKKEEKINMGVEQFNEIIPGILAIGVIVPTVIAALFFDVVVPEWLKSLALVIVGYYFGAKIPILISKLKGKK